MHRLARPRICMIWHGSKIFGGTSRTPDSWFARRIAHYAGSPLRIRPVCEPGPPILANWEGASPGIPRLAASAFARTRCRAFVVTRRARPFSAIRVDPRRRTKRETATLVRAVERDPDRRIWMGCARPRQPTMSRVSAGSRPSPFERRPVPPPSSIRASALFRGRLRPSARDA